jgi:hypothetical protein
MTRSSRPEGPVCNAGTWEAEVGASLQVQGQSGLQSESLSSKITRSNQEVQYQTTRTPRKRKQGKSRKKSQKKN